MEVEENGMNARTFENGQDISGHRCAPKVSVLANTDRGIRREVPPQTLNPERQSGLVNEQSPLVSEQVLRRQAAATAKEGNYTRAIALYNQLIASYPANAIDYNNRGLVYFQTGQMSEAIADYNRAIELSPKLAPAYNNRGNCYAARGLLVEAMLDYDMAIDLNPFNVRALINQGITLRDLEIYDLSIENFDIALAMGQMEDHIWAERGRTYHLMGEWNAAIADYQRALEALGNCGLSCSEASRRLRCSVQNWLDQLLNPSKAHFNPSEGLKM